VILRAVSDDSFDPTDGDIDDTFLHTWGPVTSAQTIVFHNREAAFDPRVLAALQGADGIFLAGGDQGNYLRYWKGTPVQVALNKHVASNRPIGGSSAGLAILGRYSYTCLDGNSMESKDALTDPYNASMTLESDFLHYRGMENVMTDTHFSARHRLGRLITFVARFNADQPGAKTFGLGIDEKTAVLVGADGIGRIAASSVGSAWLVLPQQPAITLAKGEPLSIKDVRIVRLDGGSSIDLKTRAIKHAAAEATISILHGKPTADSIASPILQRDAVPSGES
jgi:cyanophycinase